MVSYGALRRWWRARRRKGAAARTGRDAGSPLDQGPAHLPGRAHLVLRDGGVVEARLDARSQARLVYLARRVAAPPPPER